MGLEKTGRIGRVIIDPRNPDVVFAAALGTCYGPQPERGVYRTTDGGKTWERVLFVDENTGASDLAMDPTNPRILFAGTWQIDIKTWGRKSGGPGSGVFVSRDGGTTWKRITGHGLPDPPLGKIAVAVAPSDPAARLRADRDRRQRGSLWRSDDGGEKWKLVNHSRLLNERPHYYTRMLVMPDNANEVYFPSNGMGVTYDGGETADQIRLGRRQPRHVGRPEEPEPDDDRQRRRRRDLDDARKAVELDAPADRPDVPRRDRQPDSLQRLRADAGRRLDARPEPQSRAATAFPPALWTSTAGCETGWTTPDPVDPNIVWGGCYAGVVERFDARTRNVALGQPVWPERTMGANAGQVKLRMNWTFPIAISPHDHNTVYVGSQYVHRTSDGGQSLEDDQPGPDDERSDDDGRFGRPDDRQPLRRVRGRRLLDRGVAAREGRDLGRHQRRPRPGDARRRRALDERHAGTSRAFRRRGRSTASSRRASTAAPATSRSTCTRSTTAIRSSSRRPTTGRPGRRSRRTSRRARSPTRTSCARTRSARDCSTPAPRTRSTSRSTTAAAGSRSSRSCRTRRCTG